MTHWQSIYPLTVQSLQTLGQSGLIFDFDQDYTESDLDQKVSHFPMYLKSKNVPAFVLEIVQFECAMDTVTRLDLGSKTIEKNCMQISEQMQIVSVQLSHETLNLVHPGLFAVVNVGGEVRAIRLGVAQALILDLLKEDRKFSRKQLLEMAEIFDPRVSLTSAEWKQVVDELVGAQILIDEVII